MKESVTFFFFFNTKTTKHDFRHSTVRVKASRESTINSTINRIALERCSSNGVLTGHVPKERYKGDTTGTLGQMKGKPKAT